MQKAIKLLGTAITRRLTKKEYVVVRDYLLVTLIYQNASRPGPLENALVSKTTRHEGPVEIVMDDRLHRYMQLFISHVRAFFADKSDDHIFVKEDGKAFNHGTIGRRVSEVFKREGIRSDVNVTATRLRKFFSRVAQKLSPMKKRAINKHMKHRETTADRNYLVALEAERSANAHKIMQDVMMGNLAGRDPHGSEPRSDAEEDDAIPPSPNVAESVLRPIPAGQERDSGMGAPSMAPALSTDEQVVASRVFKPFISGGTAPTRDQTREQRTVSSTTASAMWPT